MRGKSGYEDKGERTQYAKSIKENVANAKIHLQ